LLKLATSAGRFYACVFNLPALTLRAIDD